MKASDNALWAGRKESVDECKIANALIEHGTQSTWPNSQLSG